MSKYFTFKEMLHSTTANVKGFSNIPESIEHYKNLDRLMSVLDKAREKLGKPIFVNSGYRCVQLNKAVGGAANSYHLTGRAADITCFRRQDNEKLYAILEEMSWSLPEGVHIMELINEQNYTWIHVSIL